MLKQGKPNPESAPQSKTEACTSPRAGRLGRKFPGPGYLAHRSGEELSWKVCPLATWPSPVEED